MYLYFLITQVRLVSRTGPSLITSDRLLLLSSALALSLSLFLILLRVTVIKAGSGRCFMAVRSEYFYLTCSASASPSTLLVSFFLSLSIFLFCHCRLLFFRSLTLSCLWQFLFLCVHVFLSISQLPFLVMRWLTGVALLISNAPPSV